MTAKSHTVEIDYFSGFRPLRLSEEGAAKFEAARTKAKTVITADEARALIISVNHLK